MADIKHSIVYYRVRKMLLGSCCDFKLTNQFQFCWNWIYKIHFTTLVVVVKHIVGQRYRSGTDFQGINDLSGIGINSKSANVSNRYQYKYGYQS